jgi:hypothetical protein
LALVEQVAVVVLVDMAEILLYHRDMLDTVQDEVLPVELAAILDRQDHRVVEEAEAEPLY